MSASSEPSAGEDQRRRGVLDPCALEILGVGRIAAHEVDAGPGRVLLDIRQDHDLLWVVVTLELIDQVARGAVPAAHHDVVLVAR
jgi:hypothetical protein